jgi:restriction system protein
MAIPDFQSTMRPLLAAISDGKVHRFIDAFEAVCRHFNLSEEEIQELLPSGKQTIIRNRVAWANTYLKKAGLIEAPERAHIRITDLGLKALKDRPGRVDVKYLKQYEVFREFHTAKAPAGADTQQDDDTEITDPVERLEQAHKEIQANLTSELLETVKTQSPQFLEKLIVELMLAMGYGGWSKESGKTTQYVADEGIDGIINEDPLGMDTIYLQAKRYTEGTVGRPEVQAFVGALEMKRSRKGVFITTSKFSNDALDYVNRIEKKIVLINGEELARLMIQHNLGVSIKDSYQIKTVDIDYFSEE